MTPQAGSTTLSTTGAYRMDTQLSAEDSESGQAALTLLLALSIFLIACLAFAVDLSNMWFHKQQAQAAADAACQAATADMLVTASGGTPPNMGFTSGQAGDCASTPQASMCAYARFNGFNGTGLAANTESNSVSWSFPTSVPGVTAAPASLTGFPFLNVLVTENIKTWFLALLGNSYQQVAATSTCGLISAKSAPPLVVLSPTASSALTVNSNATVKLISGAQRSIEVNSNSPTAAGVSGVLDTSQAGPSNTGGDVAVGGGPNTAPAGLLPGTTGHWLASALPTPNPYATVTGPNKPAAAPAVQSVAYGTDGCPDPTGCDEYSPGYYAADIHPNGTTAIFKAGLYYLDANLRVTATGTTLRNAYSAASSTPQTDGVTFYFHTGAPTVTATPKTYPAIDRFPSSLLQCNLSSPLPAAIPTSLDGDILYAPCMSLGTYNSPPSTDTLTAAGTRGLVIFSSRSNLSITASLAGGGALAFAGGIYFHSSSYDDTVKIAGVSGSSTEVVGAIVTDLLTVTGQGTITMSLNPIPSVNVAKISLLQ